MRIAAEPWEFDAIHRLNYQTFVEEIPQHPTHPSGRLVDRFHSENTYIICVRGAELLGMIAVRGTRPFSLDHKIPDLDAHLPAGRRPCELRLLAVDKRHRSGRLLHRLLGIVWRYCREQNYEVAIISGTTRQLALYRHLGFVPFGTPVGPAEARFQPMMVSLVGTPCPRKLFRRPSQFEAVTERVNLLPGPVPIQPQVRQALLESPESHRSRSFRADLASLRALLCQLTGARRAEILLGSGTLANDAIAAQLSLAPGPGLIVTNGEFGERLADHAARFRIAHEVIRLPWGQPIGLSAVERRLYCEPSPRWLWFAHLETSTGVLNDLDALKSVCRSTGTKVCVDAVSAFGLAPLGLEDVYFASVVSGKGARAFAGLAVVLYNHDLEPSDRLPRYCDLGLYARSDGVPFTHSSNLLRALSTSLSSVDWDKRFRSLIDTSAWLRGELRRSGFRVVAPESHAAPGIVTIALSRTVQSTEVAARLEHAGFALASNSEYLRERNWIQISLMGEPPVEQLREVVEALRLVCVPPVI